MRGVSAEPPRRHNQTKTLVEARKATAAAIQSLSLELRLEAGTTRAPVSDPPYAIHRSSLPRSLAFCHRSSGSLATQVRIARSRAGGVSGWAVEIGGGSFCMIAEITEA